MRALIGLLIGWSVAASLPVAAQSFPSKPLRFVVPFPGGFSHVLARQIGARMGDALGQPIALENRPPRWCTPWPSAPTST